MKIISHIFITIIKIYKLFISPFLNPSCRYLPTCSEYFIDCLKIYGPFKGFYFGTNTSYASNTKISVSTGTGAYTSDRISLDEGTTYYINAYAVNMVQKFDYVCKL